MQRPKILHCVHLCLIMNMKSVLFWPLVAAVASAVTVARGSPLEEEWGFVTVRPKAHLFWALYHADHQADYKSYPLIMWLQGGPGFSATGLGNFMSVGPYDIDGNKRRYAWTKKANLLFVDSPVGVGYSYVEDDSALVTNNSQIADDLVICVKKIFKANPDLENMPFFVFAESYGGKMAVDFALAFQEAIMNGHLNSDFRGVALGNSWISAKDATEGWAPFLYNMGYVNREGRKEIHQEVTKAVALAEEGKGKEAQLAWAYALEVTEVVSHGVNVYNVLAKDDAYLADITDHSKILRNMSAHPASNHVSIATDPLSLFMNGPQRDHWGISHKLEWKKFNMNVFLGLGEDFMNPVVSSVERLLNETQLQVVVYTGNLDMMCSTPSTYKWIENMNWPEKSKWMATKTQTLHVTAYSSQAANVQRYGNFALVTIFRSGHMVPMDVPEMALVLVEKIMEFSGEAVEKQPPRTNLQLGDSHSS